MRKTITTPFSKKGQILVIFILIMVVALTIGLSIASRSIKNVSNVETTEKSERAFNAAEAGIEDALIKDLKTISDTAPVSLNVGNATTQYKVTSVGGSTAFTTNKAITADDAIEINVYYDPSQPGSDLNINATSLDIYWGDKGKYEDPGCSSLTPGNMPASIDMFFVKETGTDNFSIPTNAHYAYNACDNVGNGFSDSLTDPTVTYDQTYTNGNTQISYRAKANIPIPSISNGEKLRILRIKTWYNKASMTIVAKASSGTAKLPTQAYKIQSVGEAVDTQGQGSGVKRSVEVVKSSPSLPGFFNNVLYNGSTQKFTK